MQKGVGLNWRHLQRRNVAGISEWWLPAGGIAPNVRKTVPLYTTVVITGWGNQNDSNHQQLVTQLKHLRPQVIDCSPWPDVAGFWEAYPEHPEFICIGAQPGIGGPCYGDQGGENT